MRHVRLNLVQPEQRRPVAGRVNKAVAVHLAKGGVEQVPHEKVPLDYRDIPSFSPPAGISRQRTLIEGVEDVRRHCPSFAKLAQLALDGIEKDTIIFPDLDFEVDPALLGFFNGITARNRLGIISCTSHFLHLTLQEFMAALAVAKKTPEEQVTFWKRHLTLRYNKEGRFVLAPDRYHRLFLFYSGVSGLSTPGIQSMLLDTLNTVGKPSVSRHTPLPELCEAVAESGNAQLARSILSPCGPTVVIYGDSVYGVGAAWCVVEYCKQVDGAGISIEGRYGVAKSIPQLGDVSTLVRVEMPLLYRVDGKLSHASELIVPIYN